MLETGVLEQMQNYELIRDKLLIRPIYFSDCRRELKEYVYERYGDVALVLYLTVYDGENGLGTIKVPRTTVDGWRLPRKRVWEDAMLNTYVTWIVWALPMKRENSCRKTVEFRCSVRSGRRF